MAKVGASLQHAISHEPRISFFASTGYLLVHRVDAVVSCIVLWNLRQFNSKQLFIHKPD